MKTKRIITFFIALGITTLWLWAVNRPYGPLPPPIKFFSPFEGYLQNAESANQKIPKVNTNLKELKEPVDVYFDDRRVPHIFAQNEYDLFFMQGYLTASERLWQMDFQIRAASGRLSEIVGAVALDFDRLNRRKGIAFGAEQFMESLNGTEEEKILKAYVDGVNAYVNRLSYRDYPLEFKLLNYEPEEWSVYKTALLLMYMSDMLAGHDNDFAYTRALEELGKELFDILYPDFFLEDSPVITFDEGKIFNLPQLDTPDLNPVFTGNSKASLPKAADRALGSNNWALSADLTLNGNPLLSNDPHLALNLPSIWYEVQLHSPGINVYGVSLPGSPSVIIGFNEHISWGVTNSALDVRDWYSIDFEDETRSTYRFDNQWKQTEKRAEVFHVKGEKPFIDTVIYTHWGPVTYDENFNVHPDFINFACRWIAHDPSLEHITFYSLNKGKNLKDYQKALEYYSTPGQNFVFASKEGDIALTHQGLFPARWPEQGKFLMDGSKPENAWQAFIPQDDLPREINPEKGYVSSANQHPTDSAYPYFYTGFIFENYRNRRINELLSEMENATVEDLRIMLNDNYNLMAAEVLPLMLSSINQLENYDEYAEKWVKKLTEWDYFNEVDYKAPTLFQLWHDSLMHQLWSGLKQLDPAIPFPHEFVSQQLLEKYIDTLWILPTGREGHMQTTGIINTSFVKAIEQIKRWEAVNEVEASWGDFKGTRLAHLAMIEPFYVKNLPIGGNKHIVNATSTTHGPSWRMIVELGDTVQGYGIYPGGQSGNPGSYFYDNFAMDWAVGKLYELTFLHSKDDAEKLSLHKVEFKP
ncbi:MAG: penicillin acylase family protein [Chitinophagaceae bacterium]|nr:MAG: penicillin acylase family protein [Chitinophagaceae bacterium]